MQSEKQGKGENEYGVTGKVIMRVTGIMVGVTGRVRIGERGRVNGVTEKVRMRARGRMSMGLQEE